jgi:lipopolysaccharide/colanic/teichoic acid biosynthesis glycosyltransferase
MRRLVDLFVAGIAGLLLAPVIGLVALLVWSMLGRPVLFRQHRSGIHGHEFTIVKFRTMRPPGYAGESDPDRETSLGRVLRRLSLDELPQLWNVIRGDMSLIGPRPTLPEQVMHYSARQRGRLAVRPGITGWAQVHGRNSISWPERIELDLWYIKHRSFFVDLRIIWLTVIGVLRPRGITGDGGVNEGFPVSDKAVTPASVNVSVPTHGHTWGGV